ncbi:MAG: GC-type dockerin domain-anchored protein [Planctomycetota bacterium]
MNARVPLVALGSLACSASAQGVFVLDSLQQCFVPPEVPSIELDLPPGLYQTVAVGDAFDAWNAWGGSVDGCDGDGLNCTMGWLTGHAVSAESGNPVATRVDFGAIAATPALALQEPRRVLFRRCDSETLFLGVGDSHCADNVGTVAVRIELAACPPDFNLDGELNFFDFLEFQNLFEESNAIADLDCDGEFTVTDFNAFQALFAQGCSPPVAAEQGDAEFATVGLR